MITDEMWKTWLTNLAERYRDAYSRADEDVRAYPREANAVAELASLIAGSNTKVGLSAASVILEAEYWHQEIHGEKLKRTCADIWRKEPELFVEVKLGYQEKSKLVGDWKKTLRSYAYDVWRLLSLGPRAGQLTECALVVVASGDLPEVETRALETRKEGNAANALELLQNLPDPSLAGFFAAAAGDVVGAQVICGDLKPGYAKNANAKNPDVRCYALRWVLDAPWVPGSRVKLSPAIK